MRPKAKCVSTRTCTHSIDRFHPHGLPVGFAVVKEELLSRLDVAQRVEVHRRAAGAEALLLPVAVSAAPRVVDPPRQARALLVDAVDVIRDADARHVPAWKTKPVWPASENIAANWPRLEAALSLIWR
eukprot:scaffold82672_cov75-Phaeocystis_antarctica.AAC.2